MYVAFSLLSIFTAQPHAPSTDTAALEPLEAFARRQGLHCEIASEIFYHNERVLIPCLIFDRHRGIYLFDSADWDEKSLRSCKAEAAPKRTTKHKDVDVDTPQKILMRKLDEVRNKQECAIAKFLYLPNLDRAQFETLDPSFRALLPASRVIFADDSDDEIARKLAAAIPYREHPVDLSALLGALYIQYTLLPDIEGEPIRQLSPQQKALLHRELPPRSLICGPYGSGKSTLLLLKALLDALHRPERSVAIIQPTLAACERMSARLLELIEHAVVHIDPTAIRIATPKQICREHYLKVHKAPPLIDGNITEKMLHRNLPIADTLFIDDAHLIEQRYLDYFRTQQKRGSLHLVTVDPNEREETPIYTLEHGFRLPHSLRGHLERGVPKEACSALEHREGNAYIEVLNLLPQLLEHHAPETLMIVTPNPEFAASLQEEIADFIGCSSTLLDAHKTLLNQDMEQLLIVPMDGLSGLQRDQVLIIRDGETPQHHLRHAIGRTAVHAYLISHQSESS